MSAKLSHRETSAIILKMTYGYSMGKESEDPLVNLIEKMMDNFSQAFVPLAWPVDLIPQLRHLRDGFPGTGYRKTAQAWRQVCQSVCNTPYNFVRMQMDSGVNAASYVSALVERLSNESENGKLSEVDEKTVKLTAAVSYGGGADTTLSTLTSFVLAMLLFPKVQRKAQKEIDDALGAIRLPGFEDRERLPYVSALVKEALRWLPVLPIGTAHVVDEEFTYEGYRIPKGAYLLPSIWWFLHDPDVYSDPSSFEPDRFLGCRNEPDPAEHTFGYGRRICPGRFLAEESLFITISRVLATMNITRAVDANGHELEVKLEARPGLICHAAPFPYEIRPRSEEHADLIRLVEKSHPWEISDAKSLSIC
jgi:fumagillin biosynthesis cytochrome P450 monooxygenase